MATVKPNINELPRRPGVESHPTGFLVVRFKESIAPDALRSADAASKAQLSKVFALMQRYRIDAVPLLADPAQRRRVAELEQKARHTKFSPLRSLLSYWRFDARKSAAPVVALQGMLRGQPGVAAVSVEFGGVEAGPPPDPYLSKQGYLAAAKEGIDALWAWDLNDGIGKGKGTRFLDIERGWLLGHEDLPPATLVFNDNYDEVDRFAVRSHGAAVLGIVAAAHNQTGVAGIAPDVDSVDVASIWRQDGEGGDSQIALALAQAMVAPSPPDVVLIEVQVAWWIPAEAQTYNFDAIRLATSAGICVVEVAGNLGFDLDTFQNEAGVFVLDTGDPAFKDSGAILVGSADAALPHAARLSSNHGSRVDCYAWGEEIVASGGGDLSRGAGDDSTYTADFGGTSGAAAIIAGAALVLQGLAQALSRGQKLAPEDLRDWLKDPSTGTPADAGARIGVMPNLRLIGRKRLGLT